MQHIRVEWIHSYPDEPVEIYSEIDDEGWEIRKLEIFPDGTVGYADSTCATETTFLSIEKMCPIEEIAAQPEFTPHVISKEDFEAAWQWFINSK